MPRPAPTLARIGALVATAVIAMLACALLVGLHDAHRSDDRSPGAASATTTVRRFLEQAAVTHNGYAAAQYLTPAEQAAVAGPSSSPALVRQALQGGTAPFGLDTTQAVQGLHLQTVVRGATATVVARSGSRPPVAFTLQRTGVGGGQGYRAPQSAWRIADGVPGLYGLRTTGTPVDPGQL